MAHETEFFDIATREVDFADSNCPGAIVDACLAGCLSPHDKIRVGFVNDVLTEVWIITECIEGLINQYLEEKTLQLCMESHHEELTVDDLEYGSEHDVVLEFRATASRSALVDTGHLAAMAAAYYDTIINPEDKEAQNRFESLYGHDLPLDARCATMENLSVAAC